MWKSLLEAIPSQDIIDALCCVRLPLFPSLREFECTNLCMPWEDLEMTSLLTDYRLFFGITMLRLRVDNFWIDEQAGRMIADIPRLCPHLEVLGINEANDNVHVRLDQPLLPPGFFRSLPALQSVEIGHALPAPVFEELRSLPNLDHLYFVPGRGLPWIQPFPYTPFANLTSLRLNGGRFDTIAACSEYEPTFIQDAEDCASVLATSSFPNLESLCIVSGDVGSFGIITRIVATHCSSASLHQVSIQRDDTLTDYHLGIDDVTADDIEPLYAFEQLEFVCLEEAHNFLLTDDDFLKMALAWPHLRYLSLTPGPTEDILGYDMARVPYPSATLWTLVHFARHCPELELIRIRLATDSPDGASIVRDMQLNGEEIPESDLETLHICHGLPLGDRNEIKVLLNAIFPRLKRLFWITNVFVEDDLM